MMVLILLATLQESQQGAQLNLGDGTLLQGSLAPSL